MLLQHTLEHQVITGCKVNHDDFPLILTTTMRLAMIELNKTAKICNKLSILNSPFNVEYTLKTSTAQTNNFHN